MLCQIAANAIDHFANSGKSGQEKFADSAAIASNNNSGSRPLTLGYVIVVILWILLVLIVGKWLWNTVLCKVLTVAQPMPNILYFFGLVLLVEIISPSL